MDPKLAEALSEITTGIYVLTVSEGSLRHGMSLSWVTQVSGDPPLIMAAVDQRHFSHGVVSRQGVFGLNVVGGNSKELEDYFFSSASRQPDNLNAVAYESGETGVPLLTQAMAIFECRVVGSYPAGDHTLFVASIVRAEVREHDRPVTSLDLPYVYVGTIIQRH
ncbi:MAG TPA: flavin reductase family protein [Methylomirabilota bacterium]|jgi:flavin reductase (DIM6/NTAB) family NADH-FMN oxidoreductase RutF|nr:flavin reductase family protein [Methylomirabilota bacterium]